jgi:5-formyltetrahydrofolate cyclo-ligase
MMSFDKRAIRQELRARRKGLSPAFVTAAGHAVCGRLSAFPPYNAAASVLVYLACEYEVPTTGLIERAVASNKTVYLPHTASGAMVRWTPGDPLVIARGGVAEPVGAPLSGACPAIALIPVVGWDWQGTRLGRGGGFYDRLLADLPPTIRVGLAYDFQQVASLPRDSWDIALDYVITEQRVIRCGWGEERRPALLQEGGLR